MSQWIERLPGWAVAGALFGVVFSVYLLSALVFGWSLPPNGSYWNLLADAVLHGRLYLLNPPSTYDLTLYQGHWYVPNPPLPGLLALPYVWALGLDRANPLLFSYLFCGLNAALVFLILEQAAVRQWITLPRAGRLLLVALFAFGTPHWWVGVDGRMWFISQVLTVTFSALAALLALRERPAWLVGLSLGAAVLGRSNVFVLWPFLLAIALQIQQEKIGRLDGRQALKWSIASALPVVLSVGLLLWYNMVRFNNPLDFGYITINGAAWLVNDVRTYGMFNLHFLPRNLRVMFLNLPDLKKHSPFVDFPIEGLSLFITTPALVYLFRRWTKAWWAVGAWVSVLLSIGLLALYHNTGAVQFGYRYLLDFIVPLLMLLAYALGKRPGWLFSLLVAASWVINGVGLAWFVALSKQ